MKTTELTLAEALATGRPFKHKDEEAWASLKNSFVFYVEDAYENVWEILPEEKPPMRVWKSNGDYLFAFQEQKPTSTVRNPYEWEDVTESLAKALAPLIKEELGL